MKKALLLLLALCCLTLPAQAADFYDLPADHWAAEPIRRAVEAAYKAAWRRWSRFIDEPLSRYDMAQIVRNLLEEREALPQEEDMLAVRGSIADWAAIPENYRSAVSACWAGGVLQGRSGGRFDGTESLNRAQACVIWSRLDRLFGGGQDEEEPAPEGPAAEMPAFGLQGDETVQQMMNRINAATPRAAEGCLPNGKARTEENIQELLELVKQGCPDGTAWNASVRYEYKAPKLGPTTSCLSFGMAVSDFVFGEQAPVTQRWEGFILRVGDMIHIKAEGTERVLILTGVDYEKDAYTACGLKRNGKVKWSDWRLISGLVDGFGFTTVYKRLVTGPPAKSADFATTKKAVISYGSHRHRPGHHQLPGRRLAERAG